MTDTRQVLEEAWERITVRPPSYALACRDDSNSDETLRQLGEQVWDWAERKARFTRFLDAEAWTDAAMMLLDRTRWRILSLHETEVEDAPPFEIRLGQRDAGFGRARIVHGTGETEALALAQACLKARENGDG